VLSLPESSINENADPTPLVTKSIKKDIDAAKTHLDNHVTIEEKILTLDKNCEYCQIYFKE
jgi:hypothetical protein